MAAVVDFMAVVYDDAYKCDSTVSVWWMSASQWGPMSVYNICHLT